MISRPQLALPQLLYAKYHGCFLSRAFTLAPFASNASMSSRCVVFCVWIACGCGKRDRGAHCELMVA